MFVENLSDFEILCNNFYQIGEESDIARERIIQMSEDPHALFIFHNFMINTQNEKAMFIILSTITQKIPTQWEMLKDFQKEAFQKYYWNLLDNWSKANVNQTLLHQLDALVVQILFIEWPHNWPTFMNDLILNAGNDESAILNTTYFFALFSQQLHHSQLLSDRKQELIHSLHKHFQTIYNFLSIIFIKSNNAILRVEALNTLGEYLEWVDLRLISVDKICDAFYDILATHNNFCASVLRCLHAIVSRENAGADRLMTYILNQFLKTVSLNFELLSDPELVPLFLRIVSRFICLGRCALLPNDLLIEIMLEYTKYVTDDLFTVAVDTWHCITQVFMLETSFLPFSINLLLPLQYTLCERMVAPPEFNGDKGLYDKMSETLLLLFKVSHENILQVLVEKIRNPQSIEQLLPFIYSIGSISGICNVEEEKQFLTEVFNILLRNRNTNELINLSILYLISHHQRYLYHQKDLLLFAVQQFYNYFVEGSEMTQSISLKTFLNLTKSCGKLIIDNMFAQPFFENISTILSHISPHMHILFFENMINLVKACANLQIKQQIVHILFNFATSYEILTILMEVALESEQEQVEKVILNILNQFPQCCQNQIEFHAIYELFKHFLKKFPNTNLLSQLTQTFFVEFSQTHSFESFDCFTILIDSGNVGLIPQIFNQLIQPTFSEISSTFSEHPEHRHSFYSLILSMFKHFEILDKEIFTELFNYTFFGLQHPQNDISELSLNCISIIISKVESNEEIIEEFYKVFYVEILSHMFNAIFDGMHSFLFMQLTQNISYLLQLVLTQKINFINVNDLEEIMFQKVISLFPNHNREMFYMFVENVIRNVQNIAQLRQMFNNFIVAVKQITPDQIDDDLVVNMGFGRSNVLLNDATEDLSFMLENEIELEEI